MCAISPENTLTDPSENITVERVYKAEATTGEGSIWHPDRQTLFWVDIEGQTLYEYIPSQQDCRKWTFNKMISTVVPETEETVVVALWDEIIRINVETNERTFIASIDDRDGTVRCNDGKCDPAGRLWIGTITQKALRGTAVLYTVTRDGMVTPRLTGLTNSNGIVWSADKKYMYHNDTPTLRIARYKYDVETGDIEFDGVAVMIPEGTGRPDGMTIDKDDNLWVAKWGGHGVYCYNPHTGKLLTKIEVPAVNVPSCAFGGENLDTLYITTARKGQTPEDLATYPDTGSLFSCKPGAIGVPANKFN